MRIRSFLLFLFVLSALLSCADCMAQVKSSSHFNTIGEVGMQPKCYTDIREIKTEDEYDDTMGDNEMVNPPADSIKAYVPIVAFPLKVIRINSPYGVRKDPMNRRNNRMHNGIDLKARYEEVYSMLPGVVADASYSTNGGYYVTVNHGICVCSYLHLSKIHVKIGQRITAGQMIAISGNTGMRTTGPHLHISCRWGDRKGKFFNPMLILGFVSEQLLKKN